MAVAAAWSGALVPSRITRIRLAPCGSLTACEPARPARAVCWPFPFQPWQLAHAPSKPGEHQVARRVAFTAKRQSIHEIGAAVPRNAVRWVWFERFAVEEQQLPSAHDATLVERIVKFGMTGGNYRNLGEKFAVPSGHHLGEN